MKTTIWIWSVALCVALGSFVPVDARSGGLEAEDGWGAAKKEPKDKVTKEKGKSSGVEKTIQAFREADPDLERFFSSAAGYAVFPGVGKGGMGIGGAYGKGEVYEAGKLIGKTSVKQVTIGFQLGGQKYSEVIFFKDQESLDAFKSGNFEFSAQVSAIAAAAGVSKDAPYERGVAVFTLAGKGLMYEATVGGQKFTFEPLGKKKEKKKDR